MAKTNKEAIMKLCKSIESKEGQGSVFTLGSKHANLKIPRWSTGIEDLDHIIGGGMPVGRIIEVFGAESSGKTSLGYHLASMCPLALYIPIEGTFDSARARGFGNTPKQMIVYRARYGEQAMNKIIKFAQAGIPLIVLDSVPACKPKEDVEKLMKGVNANNDDAVNERMGGVARLMHKYLPLIEEICEVSGTTLMLINQIRDKVGAMAFGDQTDTPGGRGPKFYSSVRMKIARKAWIEIPNKNPKNAAQNEKVGLLMKVQVVKSKVCNPMQEAELPMMFEAGFVSFDDMHKARKELMTKSKKGRPVEEDDDDEEI